MLNKENLSKIGDRIKKVRQQKKLTQPELGEKIQMDKSAISKIETSGRSPSLEQLVDIAAALDVRVEYLLGIDNVVDRYTEIIKSLISSFTQITTTKEYTINSKEDAIYPFDDVVFHMDEEYLMLVGRDSIFSFIKEIADAQNLKAKLSSKAYDQMIKSARKKFFSSKESKDTKYFLVSGEQMEKIIEQAVLHQRYGEAILQKLSAAEEASFPPLRLNIKSKDEQK